MKTIKYLIMLVAILSLSISLSSCKKNDGTKDNGSTTAQNSSSEVLVERYTKSYIRGSELDKSSGRLKIVNGDDTRYVQLSSDSVTIDGYDKDRLGEQTLTVKYVSGSKTYETSFKVNVYEIESATISQKPNKASYKSHETEMDLSGGIVEATANGGELKANIDLKYFEVTGFDSALATEEYKTAPLKQTISVIYNGKTICQFDIQISYSDVSFVKDALKNVEEFNIDEEGYGVSVEALDAIIDAASKYTMLSLTDKKAISEEEFNKLAICASVYGFGEWGKIADQLGDTFAIVNGKLGFRLRSYESTRKAVDLILGNDSKLLMLSDLLCDLRERAANVYVNKDVTVERYLINVIPSEDFTVYSKFLQFATEIYEAIEPVKEWDLTNIKDYSDEVMKAFETIVGSSYSEDINLRSAFGIISKWRENDDLFEIIYSYFYVLGNDDTTNAYAKTCIDVLKKIYLPGRLEDLYMAMMTSGMDLNDLNSFHVIDTTYFVDYYKQVIEIAEKVFDEENPLYDMYETFYFYITFDNIITQNGEYIDAGFSTIVNYLRRSGLFEVYANCLSSEKLSAFWDRYLEIYDDVQANKYEGYDKYAEDIEELFGMYQSMSPSEMYDINYSLCYVYGQNQFFDYYVWDIPTFMEYGSYDIIFVGLVANHFNKLFLENEISSEPFNELMAAVESYSRTNLDEKALGLFMNHMNSFESSYDSLDAKGKEIYDSKFAQLIDNFRAIASLYDAETLELKEVSINLGAYESLIDDLKISFDYINGLADLKEYVLEIPEIFNALLIADEIVNSNEPGVIAYYSTYIYKYGNMEHTLDSMTANIRYQLKVLLTESRGIMGNSTYLLYDLIDDEEVMDYVKSIYMLMRNYVDHESTLGISIDKGLVIEMIEKYVGLDSEDRMATYSLTYCTKKAPFVFFMAEEYIKETLGDDAYECAKALVASEMNLKSYDNNKEGIDADGNTYESLAKTSYEKYVELYEALSSEIQEGIMEIFSSLVNDLDENHI